MSDIEDIRDLVKNLSPRAFGARLDYWRRGGVAGSSLGDRVSGTRAAKLPHFDRTDEQLNAAETAYTLTVDSFVAAFGAGDHKKALEHLRAAEMLERKWLVPIGQLTPKQLETMDKLVTDASSCRTCGITKEAWLRAQRQAGRTRSLWRLKGSDCAACYMKKRRDRLAVLAVMDPDPQAVAS